MKTTNKERAAKLLAESNARFLSSYQPPASNDPRATTARPLDDLRFATLKAREVDPIIGTHVEAGQLRVIHTTMDARGNATVTPLTGWLAFKDALAHMRMVAAGGAA